MICNRERARNSKKSSVRLTRLAAFSEYVGSWRTDPASLALGGTTGFRSMRFEAICPTGLGGTSPHLDLLAEGDLLVAVESKCTEWMQTHKSDVFSFIRKLAAFPQGFSLVRASAASARNAKAI